MISRNFRRLLPIPTGHRTQPVEFRIAIASTQRACGILERWHGEVDEAFQLGVVSWTRGEGGRRADEDVEGDKVKVLT